MLNFSPLFRLNIWLLFDWKVIANLELARLFDCNKIIDLKKWNYETYYHKSVYNIHVNIPLARPKIMSNIRRDATVSFASYIRCIDSVSESRTPAAASRHQARIDNKSGDDF